MWTEGTHRRAGDFLTVQWAVVQFSQCAKGMRTNSYVHVQMYVMNAAEDDLSY